MLIVQVATLIRATWTHRVHCLQSRVYDRPPDSPGGCVVQQHIIQEQNCDQHLGCSQGIALETMCVRRIAYVDVPKGPVC